MGTAAVAPAEEAGGLTGVMGVGLIVGGGGAGESKALAEKQKRSFYFFDTIQKGLKQSLKGPVLGLPLILEYK